MRAELVTFESEHFRQFNSVGVLCSAHTYIFADDIFL